MTLLEKIRLIATVYCSAKELSFSRVSRLAFGDGTKLEAVLSGKADLTTRRYEKTMIWFSGRWPEGTNWPPNIERPSV